MYQPTPADNFLYLLNQGQPRAIAWIQGNTSQPQVAGSVKFYQTSYGGVLIEAEIFGLPNIAVPSSSNFYGFHIHESGNCQRPFDQTGNHYNPDNMPHPQHAGDMPGSLTPKLPKNPCKPLMALFFCQFLTLCLHVTPHYAIIGIYFRRNDL